MAKELPYFKFEPNQWQNGNIQLCSDKAKINFIEICCFYWSRLGNMQSKFALIKCCNGDIESYNELTENNIIQDNNGNIKIKFLDEQLKDFVNKSSKASESGKKGGQKGGVRPELERIKGNQIYILKCWGNNEEFYKIGTTSDCISRRYSGKIQYEYQVVFQYLTDEYLVAENDICEQLRTVANCEYLPKLTFAGSKECFKVSDYKEIEDVFNDYFKFAQASIKRNEPIREEKRREEKKNKSLLSEIKISDDKKFFLINDLKIDATENEVEYFTIAEKFRKLFIKNLKEKKSPVTHQEKATFKSYVSPIRLMIENKEANIEQLREAYNFLNSIDGEFWKSNILSTASLRKQIATLIIKKNMVKVPQNKKEENIPDHKKRNQL